MKDTIHSNTLNNTRVQSLDSLATPQEIRNQLPINNESTNAIYQWRTTIENIMDRTDQRLLVIVGPCSIHDESAALDYAEKLAALSKKIDDSIFIVMRVYFEKPRTTVGWKGLINDPHLDNSFRIEEGIIKARKLLIALCKMGLPTGTEALDPIIPQYIQELISWTAIGARTSESQTHREMASGLSMPVGFKNGTDGSIDIAINALNSSISPHRFLGIDQYGQVSVVHTKGNRYGHLVLRGGNGKPNYNADSIAKYEQALIQANVKPNIVVDASHANSQKKPENQATVIDNITQQIQEGNRSIIGVMLESNIGWGNQSLPEDTSQLSYGVSITDACIDWPTTENVLLKLAEQIRPALSKRANQ